MGLGIDEAGACRDARPAARVRRDAAGWDAVVAQLDAERYRPLAPDLRGHGDGAATPRPIDFEAVRRRRPRRGAAGASRSCGYSIGRPGRAARRAGRARARRRASCSSPRRPGSRTTAERAARRRARTTRSAADARARRRSRRSPTAGCAQPLFAGDPPEARARRARATSCATTRAAWPPRCAASAPASMAPLWDRLGELTCPRPSSPGSATRSSPRWPSAWRPRCRRRGCRSCPGAGHGLPREAPGRGRRRDRRRALDAEPGAARHGDPAVLELEDVELPGEQRQRPQPAGRGRAQRRGAVHGRGDPERPVEASRRRRRRRRTRARARPGPAAPRCRRSARPSGRRRRRPRPSARRAPPPSRPSRSAPATRSRTARSASTPWTGSSTSSRPAGASASMACTASSTVPGAVRVEAQRHLGADRRAHGGDPAGVVADPDLDLHAPEAVPRGGGGLRGGARRGPRRAIVALTGSRGQASSVSSSLTGRPSRLPGAVPEREVDRGERLRQRRPLAAGVEQLGAGRRRRRAGSARRPRRRPRTTSSETPS